VLQGKHLDRCRRGKPYLSSEMWISTSLGAGAVPFCIPVRSERESGTRCFSRCSWQSFGHRLRSAGSGYRSLGGRRNLGASNCGEAEAKEEALGGFGKQVDSIDATLVG
jgi:hypothetical protein